MAKKSLVVHEKAGEITLIELNSLKNVLPVKAETFKRIVYGLAANGYLKLPVKPTEENNA